MVIRMLRSLNFWGMDANDNMRNRRNLAFFSAIYSLILWPNILIALRLIFDLEIELIKALLIYVGTVAGGTIGGYIWASLKEPRREVQE